MEKLKIENKWLKLPITVLFSPSLRLRYHVAWEYCATKVNESINHCFFSKAMNASNKDISNIELLKEKPQNNCIYVCDCLKDDIFTGFTSLFLSNNTIVGAKVLLPEAEVDESGFIDITFHEVLSCIGFDKGSTKEYIYQKRDRLPDEVIQAIITYYNL
jgi:hypothetical protein